MCARKQNQPSPSRVLPVEDIRELVQMMQEFSLAELEWKDGERHLRLSKQGESTGQQNTQNTPVAYYAPPVFPPYMMVPPAVPGGMRPEGYPTAPVPGPQAETPAQPPEKTEEEDESHLVAIRSPMVGTFYAAPAPEKPPFVEVGSHVEPDTIVCIIEAMKVFNEIPAEVRGKIVKVLVENGQPVEYGQPLFLVDPTG